MSDGYITGRQALRALAEIALAPTLFVLALIYHSLKLSRGGSDE